MELDTFPYTCSIRLTFDMYFLHTWPFAWVRLLPAFVPEPVSNLVDGGWIMSMTSGPGMKRSWPIPAYSAETSREHIVHWRREAAERTLRREELVVDARCIAPRVLGAEWMLRACRIGMLGLPFTHSRIVSATAQPNSKSPRHTTRPVANHITAASPCRKTTRSRPTLTWR